MVSGGSSEEHGRHCRTLQFAAQSRAAEPAEPPGRLVPAPRLSRPGRRFNCAQAAALVLLTCMVSPAAGQVPVLFPRDYGDGQTVTFTGGQAGGSYELRVSSPDGSGIVNAAHAFLGVTFLSHTQFKVAPRYVTPGDFIDLYLFGKTETRGAVYAVGGTAPVSDILDIDVVYDPSAQFEDATFVDNQQWTGTGVQAVENARTKFSFSWTAAPPMNQAALTWGVGNPAAAIRCVIKGTEVAELDDVTTDNSNLATVVVGETDTSGRSGIVSVEFAAPMYEAGGSNEYTVRIHNYVDQYNIGGESGSTGCNGSALDVRFTVRENSAPVFGSSTVAYSMDENTAAGQNVGAALTATDTDNDTLTYSLEGTDAESFDIVAASGQIKTKTGVSYSYEAKGSYAVTVKADDGFGGTDTVAVTIALNDVDEQPDKPAAPTLEPVSGSTTTLTATWTKPGLNGGPDITDYNVQFRQGAGGTWADFSHRGAEVATTLTGLTADTEYQARVQAVNGETPSDWSDASDGVKTNSESNNAPVFADDEVALEVPENSAAGTDVGDPIPEATDADTGDTLTYSLEGTDAASFDFDASTRQITTGTGVTYNHEGKNTYEVKVKAGDGKGRTDTIDVTIDVTDVDEKSATPDRPTLAAVSGSSTSLDASWSKPGLNGGPDIIGYNVDYRQGTSGNREDFTHDGTGLTATITGLTANTEYQVRVQAVNGETDSDWSDPSDAVRTNAEGGTPTPTVTLRLSDADGEVSEDAGAVTVRAAVSPASATAFTVTVSASPVAPATDDDFELSASRVLSFARNATESTGTVTIRIVDDDEREPDEVVTVSGAVSNAAIPDPDDVTLTILDDDAGPPPTITSALVASAPQSGNTYHWGETIVFTATFSEPVRVTGRPGLEVGLDDPAGTSGSTVQARFWGLSENGETGPGARPAPVSRYVHFAYTVQPFDRDADGVRIGADALRLASGDVIRSDETGARAELAHAAPGRLTGHRVDGRTTVDGEPAAPAAGAGIRFVDRDGNPLRTLANGRHRLTVPEGGSARYGLRLETRPAHAVVVSHHYMYEGDPDLAVPRDLMGDRSIAPDEWNTRTVWVEVEAAQDFDAEDGERVFENRAASNDPSYHDLALPDVVAVEADDDAPSSSGERALQGRFISPPGRHDGAKRVKVRVGFSEPIDESPENVGEHGVEVEGGEVTSVRSVGGNAPGGSAARSTTRSLGGRKCRTAGPGGRVGVRDRAGLGRRRDSVARGGAPVRRDGRDLHRGRPRAVGGDLDDGAGPGRGTGAADGELRGRAGGA